jgi:hypothetical protein
MNIVEIKSKLFLLLRLNKLDNTGILPPILLHELLIHKGFTDCELKQGFISPEGGGYCWHLWIEKGDDIIDINTDIACHIDENFKNLKFDFTYEIPETYDKDDTCVELWEHYNTDKKQFWKKQTMKVKNFRAKIFRIFSK